MCGRRYPRRVDWCFRHACTITCQRSTSLEDGDYVEGGGGTLVGVRAEGDVGMRAEGDAGMRTDCGVGTRTDCGVEVRTDCGACERAGVSGAGGRAGIAEAPSSRGFGLRGLNPMKDANRFITDGVSGVPPPRRRIASPERASCRRVSPAGPPKIAACNVNISGPKNDSPRASWYTAPRRETVPKSLPWRGTEESPPRHTATE